MFRIDNRIDMWVSGKSRAAALLEAGDVVQDALALYVDGGEWAAAARRMGLGRIASAGQYSSRVNGRIARFLGALGPGNGSRVYLFLDQLQPVRGARICGLDRLILDAEMHRWVRQIDVRAGDVRREAEAATGNSDRRGLSNQLERRFVCTDATRVRIQEGDKPVDSMGDLDRERPVHSR